MSRDFRPFLSDIRLACEKIERYTQGLSFEEFLADDRTWDAVLRNLMIIGEAVKQLPTDLRSAYPNTDWRNVARFRDIVVHHYFAIDEQIVWDIVRNEVGPIRAQVEQILADLVEPPGTSGDPEA